jgi:LasA protease
MINLMHKLFFWQAAKKYLPLFLALILLATACSPAPALPSEDSGLPAAQAAGLDPRDEQPDAVASAPDFTPRPNYQPAELVDYTAQMGDTLVALAAHFNTTVSEILAANSFIPTSATTMPPGMPMQVPIYYLPMWGSQYQILPDSLFVNGPAQSNFDTSAFAADYPGWLNNYRSFVSGANRTGPEIVDVVAQNYSLSPRLLLALLEYQSGALSQPADTADMTYPLGYQNRRYRGLFLQLAWAANQLNNNYYAWRRGTTVEFTFTNGRIERPDPWQNAGTVALQAFFVLLQDQDVYNYSISEAGFAAVYADLFGDPWAAVEPHIPGSLIQPEMLLPFERGKAWTYTGGPHTGWGNGEPYAAIDFAPPSVVGGCQESQEWATAIAPGVVTRSEEGLVELDLDGDGDPHTGWTMMYLHVGTEGRAALGAELNTGDRIGHPSCEGGSATGTHVHIARRYNGEWMLADGPLGFNLEGWVAHDGAAPYLGTLERFTTVVKACTCSNLESQITAGAAGEP